MVYSSSLGPMPAVVEQVRDIEAEAKMTAKLEAWQKKFEDAFGNSDPESNTTKAALAVEAALPNFKSRLHAAFDKIAPPGSPERERGGVKLIALLPKKIQGEFKKCMDIAYSIPENEAYTKALVSAQKLADHVTSAAMLAKLTPREFEFIEQQAGMYAGHPDDAMSAIAETILSVTKAADRTSRNPEYRARHEAYLAAEAQSAQPAVPPAPKRA